MKTLRIVLFLLLGLALPVNGMAHLLMPVQPCTMHGMPQPQDDMPMADCTHCQPADTPHAGHEPVQHSLEAGDQGQAAQDQQSPHCKTGLDCKPGTFLQVIISKTPDVTPSRPAPFDLSYSLLPGTSEPLGHPPRA